MRGILALAFAAAAIALPAAQAAAPASQQPAAAAAPIRIDAVVTDARGRPVRDLTADDFAIVEDGTVERVETASFVARDGSGEPGLVHVGSRSDEQAEAAKPGARLFAIFLDEYHVAKGGESDRARELVTRIIEHDFGPQDLAVVVKPLDSLINLRMTHDRSALLAAVATFEGRQGEYTPKNAFEQNYVASAPERTEAVRSQIVMSALNALATHIGGLQPGRKTMIVVSEGFARAPRRRDEALPTVESVARSANRMGVSIYTVDPRALVATAPSDGGAAAAGGAAEHDVLHLLPAETDGRAVLAPADLAASLARITADASGYYLLAFRPAHAGDARTFHSIEVRVNRPSLTVHTRAGYWSATPEDLLRARGDRRALMSTPPPQPMRHASALIHPWFGVSRAPAPGAVHAASGGNMQVSFVWDAVPPVPGDRHRNGPPALILVKASRVTDGALVYEGEVRPSNAEAAPGTPTQLTFTTAPGRLLLQLAIQDADANVLDTDVRDVIVGGLAGPVEVGTPEVLRAESAREFRALQSDLQAVPVATREFLRGDRLLLRVPVYGGTAPVAVSATLASKAGGAMRQLSVAPIADGREYQTDLPLAGLVAGEYSVTIAASSADGTASEAVPFTIVP